MTTKEHPDHFYDIVGKVFYAAAFSDKVIKPEEIETLKKMIHTAWTDHERITDSFFECINLYYDKSKALNELRLHCERYPELFDEKTKKRIINTAFKIVNSSSGTNKSEIVFISKLTNTLK
jgi:uncharacterized protein YktA (UPF0223 family)